VNLVEPDVPLDGFSLQLAHDRSLLVRRKTGYVRRA
jgi:hypothetical protein